MEKEQNTTVTTSTIERSQTQSTFEPKLIDVLNDLSKIKAETVYISELIRFVSQNRERVLVCLMVCEIIEKASFGSTLEELLQYCDTIKEQIINNTSKFIEEPSEHKNLRWTTLAKQLRVIDIENSNYLQSESIKVLKSLNSAGVTIDTIHEILMYLVQCRVSACRGLGSGVMKVSRFVELGRPLLKHINPSIAQLLPVIEALREYPVLSMDECSEYPEFMDRWEKWLTAHPVISLYLDPNYIVAEPGGHPDPGFAPLVPRLPAYTNGVPHALTDHAGPVVPNQFTSVYYFGGTEDARKFGAVLRAFHALAAPNNGVGGGVGGPLRIVHFTTTAGGMVLY